MKPESVPVYICYYNIVGYNIQCFKHPQEKFIPTVSCGNLNIPYSEMYLQQYSVSPTHEMDTYKKKKKSSITGFFLLSFYPRCQDYMKSIWYQNVITVSIYAMISFLFLLSFLHRTFSFSKRYERQKFSSISAPCSIRYFTFSAVL